MTGRTFRSLLIVGGLGFSGIALVLPAPMSRRLLARVDELTEVIVAAAAAVWTDEEVEKVA